MVGLLLSIISLDIKIRGVETEKFERNIKSPQDGLNGVLFHCYLEDSLIRMGNEINKNIPYI